MRFVKHMRKDMEQSYIFNALSAVDRIVLDNTTVSGFYILGYSCFLTQTLNLKKKNQSGHQMREPESR